MTVRKLFPLAMIFGLWIAGRRRPKDPTPAKAKNQKLADTVAEKLKSAGAVKGASVNIETREGVVDLTGTVISDAQHEEIIRVLKSVSGVKKIQSWLAVGNAASPESPPPLMRTGGQSPEPLAGPGPIAIQRPADADRRRADDADRRAGAAERRPAMAPLDPAGPQLPPYAWPTYAPYNNMSRVAYPQSYPYNAFPYIGPYYPFPKVPLGWRKVVLEWEDGHWYYGRLTTPARLLAS